MQDAPAFERGACGLSMTSKASTVATFLGAVCAGSICIAGHFHWKRHKKSADSAALFSVRRLSLGGGEFVSDSRCFATAAGHETNHGGTEQCQRAWLGNLAALVAAWFADAAATSVVLNRTGTRRVSGDLQ